MTKKKAALQPKQRVVSRDSEVIDPDGRIAKAVFYLTRTAPWTWTSATAPHEPAAAGSKQLEDPWVEMYERTLEPPLPLERMLVLFEENAPHSACICAKADDAVSQGWHLKQEQSPSSRRQRTATPSERRAANTKQSGKQDQFVTDRLAQQLEDITPDLTFAELLKQAAREEQVFGWSAWEVVRNRTKPPNPNGYLPIAGLFAIPGHTIRATRDRRLFVQSKNGRARWFKRFGVKDEINQDTGKPFDPVTEKDFEKCASEIIVFKSYSPRSTYYGIPDWISITPTLAELTAIREYNISFFDSGGTADRIVTVTSKKPSIAKKVRDDIEETLNDAAGRAHVTIAVYGTEDLKVNVQSMNAGTGRGEGNRERQFRGGREDLIKEVLMGHRTPPYRVGWADMGSLGGNAAKEMLRTYRSGGVEPVQTILEDRLNHTLFGPAGFDLQGYRWELVDLDWDTLELNIDKAIRAVESGLSTPSEARVMIGQPKSDEAAMKRFYMKQGMTAFSGEGMEDAPPLAPPGRIESAAASSPSRPRGTGAPGRGSAAFNPRLVRKLPRQTAGGGAQR